MFTKLNAKTVKNMLLGGANELNKNILVVNELNVFPVPDGDTGSNMFRTFQGGIFEISKEFNCVKDLFESFSNGAILGSRGNSGVILSEFFKGFSNALSSNFLTVIELKNAFNGGYKRAYEAVETPVEGTILTVMRESIQNVCAYEGDNVVSFLKLYLESAERSLKNTVNILPVLKEANVVDSGGAGFCCIIKGFISALSGEEISFTLDNTNGYSDTVNLSNFTKDDVLKFGYCTEVLLRLQSSKVSVEDFDHSIIISHLKSIGGESIVVTKLGDVIKIHVHTFSPGNVLNYCQNFGEFLTLKIENMTIQHAETIKPRKKIAIISVASGDGIKREFESLGADFIVDGGQTTNPSTQDFINAFNSVNADNIVVLPNNKNVILTAKQSASLYKDSKVFVVETKSIQHGYVALSLFNSSSDDLILEINNLQSALSEVVSIDVTHAVRDAQVNGKSVKKGEFMAISGCEMLSCGEDKLKVAIGAVKAIEDISNKELLTVFFGKNVTQQERFEFEEQITDCFEDLEFCSYIGEQDVYDFLICIE